MYARTAYPVAQQARGTAFIATFVNESITDVVTGVLAEDALRRRFLTVSSWTRFGPGDDRANYLGTIERFAKVDQRAREQPLPLRTARGKTAE